MTQLQMLYAGGRRIADANKLFLYFVEDGMTREELTQLIERFPEHWKRFENWLEKLPSKDGAT